MTQSNAAVRANECDNSAALASALADLAHRLLAERARRAQYFATDIFAEAGWNIMLDLYIARHRQRRVTVSDACLGSGAPHATANRWLQKLVEAGLVVRDSDKTDGRRVFVDLTPDAYANMQSYLLSVNLTPLSGMQVPGASLKDQPI
jgi:hypothetical protein